MKKDAGQIRRVADSYDNPAWHWPFLRRQRILFVAAPFLFVVAPFLVLDLLRGVLSRTVSGSATSTSCRIIWRKFTSSFALA